MPRGGVIQVDAPVVEGGEQQFALVRAGAARAVAIDRETQEGTPGQEARGTKGGGNQAAAEWHSDRQ